MRFRSLTTLVVALHVSTAAPVRAQARDSGGFDVRVPKAIGEFTLRGRRDLGEGGVMLRYARGTALAADVFVYAGPDFGPRCDSACAHSRFAIEGDDFVNSLPQLVQLKYVDSVGLTSDRALERPDGAPWRLGRHVRLAQLRRGTAESSDFVLYYLPGYRVKIRASYPSDSTLAHAIADFAAAAPAALSHRVPGPPHADHADSRGPAQRGIGISTTLPGPPAVIFPTLLRLLGEQGYTVEDSSSGAGRIVTAPRLTWPPGSQPAGSPLTESPGVRLRISLVARGDSTAIEVAGQSPTRPDWKDAGSAQALQMISIVQFAGAIEEARKTTTGTPAAKPER